LGPSVFWEKRVDSLFFKTNDRACIKSASFALQEKQAGFSKFHFRALQMRQVLLAKELD
jgi:hypothetical protein